MNRQNCLWCTRTFATEFKLVAHILAVHSTELLKAVEVGRKTALDESEGTTRPPMTDDWTDFDWEGDEETCYHAECLSCPPGWSEKPEFARWIDDWDENELTELKKLAEAHAKQSGHNCIIERVRYAFSSCLANECGDKDGEDSKEAEPPPPTQAARSPVMAPAETGEMPATAPAVSVNPALKSFKAKVMPP